MLRSIKILTALLGLGAVLAAAPLELSHDPLQLEPNSAAAKPGGNGKGRGHGRGRGSGNGSIEDQGFANGHANAGPANGRAVGHAHKDAVSGVDQMAPGQAKKAGYHGVTGSFNAIHSEAINKDVVSPNSRVAKVKAYLDAAQDLTNAQNGAGDIAAAIEAAAVAAAAASSRPVNVEMLDHIEAYSNERGLTAPGIDVDEANQDEVANRARAIQDGP